MSITILSTPPTLAQSAATDNASSSDTTTAVQDFASLLVALFAPAAIKLPIGDNTKDGLTLGETTESDNAAQTDPTSAAALLAALGIIPQQAVAANATQSKEISVSTDTGKTSTNSLAAIQSSTTLPALAEAPPAETPRSAMTDPAFAASPTLESKPAIIAANPEQITEVKISKDVTTEPTSNNIQSLASSASGNPHTIQRHHDVPLSISTPVRDQNWTGELGQKIVWLATNDKQTAQLTLNPPQMGPVEISLNLDKGNATATFVSANAEVRDTIESALPRLREMLASAGIELGQANVSAESFRQQTDNGRGNRNASQRKTDNAILDTNSVGSLSARNAFAQRGNGMVDIFA